MPMKDKNRKPVNPPHSIQCPHCSKMADQRHHRTLCCRRIRGGGPR